MVALVAAPFVGGVAASAMVFCCKLLLGRHRQQQGPEVLRGCSSLSTASCNANTMSVLSFNILADCHAWGLSYCAPELLAWDYRWPRIAATLKSADADIVCLQEVEPARILELQSWAESHGYCGLSQANGNSKPSLCVTLFKASRYQLWWTDTQRSRTLCCALLYRDSAGATQVVYVANCHLEGSPERSVERLAQARGALASMSRHQQSQGLPPEACNVVVAGDFNEGPQGGVAQLLRYGWAPVPSAVDNPLADSAAEATQPYLLQDAYAPKPLPYTRKAPRVSSTLDHIWVSAHAVISQLLHAQEPGDGQGMPNMRAPSDHLPLGATIVLPAACAEV